MHILLHIIYVYYMYLAVIGDANVCECTHQDQCIVRALLCTGWVSIQSSEVR